MTKISRMSYENLGRMIDSAVGAGILDRSSGRAHLPDPFLFRMQTLAEKYREQRTLYEKLTAEAQIIREKRNKLCPMLAQLVRNIHTSFCRFYKLGKVTAAEMSVFQIPKQASSQPANRLKVWIAFARTITRVFTKEKQEPHTTPPPYVLTEATVEILAQHLSEAEAVQMTLQRQVMKNQEQHTELLRLRQQVVHTLELVKRHLELSLYGKSKAVRRHALAAYGMLLPDGKGQSHMLVAEMKPYETPLEIHRTSGQKPKTKPEAKEKTGLKPKAEPKPESIPEPKAETKIKPEPKEKEEKPTADSEQNAEPEPEAAPEPQKQPTHIYKGKKPRGQKKIRGKKRKFHEP